MRRLKMRTAFTSGVRRSPRPFRPVSPAAFRIGGVTVILASVVIGVSPKTSLAAPFVPNRDAQCVDISPDGRLVVTGKSGMSNEEFPPRPHPTPAKAGVIQIWEASTGKMLRRMETFGDLRKICFSPDGKRIASCRLFATSDELDLAEVRLWDVETGKTIHVFDRCHDFDYSSDGRSIVVLSRSKCVIYELGTLARRPTAEPLGRAISVIFSPDGQSLAGIVEVDDRFLVRVCDVESGELLAESVALDEPFYSIEFAPDGGRLATGHGGGNILIWDSASLRPAARFNSSTPGIARPFFSPDGELIGGACQDNGDVVVWRLATGDELGRYTHEQGTFHTYYPRSAEDRVRPEKDPRRCVFGPESDLFLTGCFGGLIRTAAGGQEVRRFRD